MIRSENSYEELMAFEICDNPYNEISNGGTGIIENPVLNNTYH